MPVAVERKLRYVHQLMTARYTAKKDSTPDDAGRSGAPPLPLRSGVRSELADVALRLLSRPARDGGRRQKWQRPQRHLWQLRRVQELWHGTTFSVGVQLAAW